MALNIVEIRPPRLIFGTSFLLFLMAINTDMLISKVESKLHFYDFVLKEKSFTRYCQTKNLLVVNGQFPGPTVYVNKGDTMYVNVHNEGSYGVTIHWHGVKQPRNPWSDGPAYITQCPIAPRTNFTYEVIFSEEEGTLWWHAHIDWTRNSVHGAIVINPAQGTTTPYPTPFGEEVLVIGTWYDYDVNWVVKSDLETGADLPTGICHLINGQPGSFSNCSDDSTNTYRWSVEYGKTYLLRIVNAAMNAEEFFGVAGHNLIVVGADGAYLKPYETPYIVVAPGKTMNVLVTMNQSYPGGQYYMMAREFKNARDDGTKWMSYVPVAILEYKDVANTTLVPDIMYPHNVPMFQNITAAFHFLGNLRSLADDAHPIHVPLNITTRMFITLSLNMYVYSIGDADVSALGASMNNVSWVETETDVLQAYYSNMSGVFTEDFPDQPPYFYNFTAEDLGENVTSPLRGTKLKMLDYGEEVEIVYQATNALEASEDHPMHLHGHSFYVVGFGQGNFDPVNDPLNYNLVDPPYVNTHTVPRLGWMTLRFRANNPGVWLWHCHMDKHLSWGMNTVFIVKSGGTPETTMRDPPSYMPSCASFKSSILLDAKSNRFSMESK